MAEVTEISQAGESAASEVEDSQQNDQGARQRDRGRLVRMGQRHGAAVVAVLTLFGAAHAWAANTDWLLASLVAPLAAFLAGMVLAPISHEWGHFAGARLSGAVSPVNAQPYRWFFIFNFDARTNSATQALWMSWGGQIGSWLAVLAVLLLVPMDSLVSAVLLATVLGQALNASVFEVPVMLRTRQSQDLETEVNAQLADPGLVQWPGLFVGVATILIIVN